MMDDGHTEINESDPSDCNLTDFSTITGVFFIAIFIISVLGNGLLLMAVLLHENWKNMTTIFIINLAVSDLIFTANLPFLAVDHLHHWIFGEFFCQSMRAVYGVGLYSSVLILTALSVGRFIFVIKKPKQSFKMKYVLGTCAAAWIIGITASITDAVKQKVFKWDGLYFCLPSDSVNAGDYVKISLIFLLPFTTIVFCYSGIILMVFQTTVKRKFRSVAVILCIVMVFFICWGPYKIVLFIRYAYKPSDCWEEEKLSVTHSICRILAFSHCCMNPLLYMLSQRMRKHLYPLCRCETRQRRSPEPCRQDVFVVQNVHYSTAHSAITVEQNKG